ncbi:S41 family peptidase [Mucilaginibacter sp. FT3.2]|uniref:S41 family peptidase n=1 Tax=Mucilaginibacter sp. FT3.2 TaxID=2723090 RepID=UPI001609D0B2|nr:S41 family peptidase [Mucilaginibacter sp. FT3.2]MBB6229951.1 C-terminal processing protease CtpA/Prc [Mucilaginibacter sp. FT3.2]
MKRIFYYALVLSVGLLSACKKDKKIIVAPGDTAVITPAAFDLIRDSVYLYTKETYLWYDALPDYKTFAPRSFTGSDALTALTSEVDKMSQYKINPATGLPYEYYAAAPGEAKYSFIDDGSVSTELGGTNGDFGFSVFYNNLDHTDLRIKYVYDTSPASLAGIKRGYRITKINGRTSLNADNNSDLNFVIAAIFGTSSTISMTLLKPDNTSVDVTLKTATYTTNPVLTYKVINVSDTKKVGYIVFNTFTVVSNAGPQLLKAFTDFTTAGITDLVVDLRYNGGGSVETAEYLDNLIAPASNTGNQMFTYYYNDKLQADNHPLLSAIYSINKGDFLPANNQVKFAKIGSLNINRVFFIITGATASASELTINNLRPHMDVQFIGRTSYGKPVGFFAIDINKYQLYVPQFETRNSANQGGYYSGMKPDTTGYPGVFDNDDVTKDFGDTSEVLLHHALNYVKNGTFAVTGPKIQSLSKTQALSDAQLKHVTDKLNNRKSTLMINEKTLRRK